jgi:DNA-binding response OmpR family regulator
VLLVDDDARFSAIVQSVLEEDGYEVVVIGSAVEVDLAVVVHEPDVVVVDLVLLDSDGLEVADELRRAGRTTPVIVFSSLFDQRIARDTMAAGFGYVEKAAGLEALELAIEGALDLAVDVIDLRDPSPDRATGG